MIDDFVALVLYDRLPHIHAEGIEAFLQAIEPGEKCSVSVKNDHLAVKLGPMRGTIKFQTGQIPEEAAIASIGMTDMPEEVREGMLRHGAHAIITCDVDCRANPMESMILLLKCGMALCEVHGLALCIPACGLCLRSSLMANFVALNQMGPRCWGVEESEAGLSAYEKLTLWESLRSEAVPAELVVGFVPAEVAGKTWFFSAGHSLFGLSELAYTADDLNDYQAIRDFFRALFRVYYQKPHAMKPGRDVQINDSVTLTLEPLPEKYRDFEASTGTLMVKIVETSSPDQDWD